MFYNGETDKEVWFIERVDNNESNKDSYAGLTAGKNTSKMDPSTCSRYLTISALDFAISYDDVLPDSRGSCAIVNDKQFFSFMSGCSIDIGGIGGNTATAKRTVLLVVKTAKGNSVILTLENVSYMPAIKRSLISLSCTSNSGAKFAFGKDIVIMTLSCAPDAAVTPKPMIEFYLKHDYHVCTKAKIALLPFRESKFGPTKSHQCVDADLMSPFLESTHGFLYVLVIVDLFSHYVFVCPLIVKGDAFMALGNFILLAEMHSISKRGHLVKCFYSDNGGEVMSGILTS